MSDKANTVIRSHVDVPAFVRAFNLRKPSAADAFAGCLKKACARTFPAAISSLQIFFLVGADEFACGSRASHAGRGAAGAPQGKRPELCGLIPRSGSAPLSAIKPFSSWARICMPSWVSHVTTRPGRLGLVFAHELSVFDAAAALFLLRRSAQWNQPEQWSDWVCFPAMACIVAASVRRVWIPAPRSAGRCTHRTLLRFSETPES